MITLVKPSRAKLLSYIDSIADQPISYPHKGCTQGDTTPPTFRANRGSGVLGKGKHTFELAKKALEAWAIYDIAGMDLFHDNKPLQPNNIACVVAWLGTGYWVNPVRVVYIEEKSDSQSFAFGIGTMPGHALCGEERFCVDIDSSTEQVTYSLLSYSKPGSIVTTLGTPVVRLMQKRFVGESLKAVQRFIARGLLWPVEGMSASRSCLPRRQHFVHQALLQQSPQTVTSQILKRRQMKFRWLPRV